MFSIRGLLAKHLELADRTLDNYVGISMRVLDLPETLSKKEFKSLLKDPKVNDEIAYKNLKSLSPGSHNTSLIAIKALEKAAKAEGLLSKPILTEYRNRKTPKRLPKPVPEEEIPTILEKVTDPQDKLLLEILLGSGLRRQEAARLTFGDISFDGIVTLIGKGNKERQTFLTSEALTALQDWAWIGHLNNSPKEGNRQDRVKAWIDMPEDRGIFISSQGNEVKDFANPGAWVWQQVKQYTDYSPHQFRHFWFTDLLNNGADIGAVMDAGGHESLRTTKGYKKILKRQTTGLRAMHSREKGRL